MLEPGEIARAVEHLRGRAVELAQSLDDLRRRLAGALLGREQPSVETLEPPVDAGVELAEAAVELVRDSGQALVEQAAQEHGEAAEPGDQEDGDQRGRHGPQNARDA